MEPGRATTVADRLRALVPGSTWMKVVSGKRYVIIGTAIATETNEAVVLYRREDDGPFGQPLTKLLSRFLGTRLVSHQNGVSTYAPQFVPIATDVQRGGEEA